MTWQLVAGLVLGLLAGAGVMALFAARAYDHGFSAGAAADHSRPVGSIRFRLCVGGYELQRVDRETFFIKNPDGEGGCFPEDGLVAAISEFFDEEF